MATKHIIAGSAGFVSGDAHKSKIGPVLKYALNLSGKDKPKLCYIGTAGGDNASYIARFYDACYDENVEASHLELFTLPNHTNIEEYILSQDVIWVSGGSVTNLLAVWRVHGLDKIMRKAWEKGIILTGVSAGAMCWNVGGTTDSWGLDLKPVTNGLGLLPFSCGVHYDNEVQRRPLFQKLIADGVLPDGYATDDGVNIHYTNTEFTEALSDTPEKLAYYVHRQEDGSIKEDVIQPVLLSS